MNAETGRGPSLEWIDDVPNATDCDDEIKVGPVSICPGSFEWALCQMKEYGHWLTRESWDLNDPHVERCKLAGAECEILMLMWPDREFIPYIPSSSDIESHDWYIVRN